MPCPWCIVARGRIGRSDKIGFQLGSEYNNYFHPGIGVPRGWDVTARATRLVWDDPERRCFARVDLADKQVDGSSYNRLSFGVNLWATTRWKFGGPFGFTWLDRFGEQGLATNFLARIQSIY